MTPRLLSLPALAALAALAPPFAAADVTLPAVFGDHMVLQAEKLIPVWGTADPGEAVEVRVTAQAVKAGESAAAAEAVTRTARATADEKGNWKVTLDPLPATNEPAGFTVTGKNKLTLEDVLVGEVWVCSGQSNMEWSVRASANPEAEIAAADHPQIRLFQVKKRVASDAPLADTEGKWVLCSPQTVPNFSAVGYFFGRDVREATGRPVGLIQSAWGGTPAEAWTSAGTLAGDRTFAPILDRWKQIDEKAAAGSPQTDGRQNQLGPGHPHHPSGLYNGMIAPIVPFAVRGAIWYQGESNAGRAYQYRTLFPAMIADWRKAWGDEFPFLFVQLANYMARKDQPAESAWAELREAQSLTLSLPKTGQAVIIDIGEENDIHPKNKQDVGKRLALIARKLVHGEDVVASGPTFKGMTVEGNKAALTFDHVGGGLEAKGGALKGFAVAGADKVFKWADAAIEGDKVVVSSPEVSQPVAVRYAWADNPEATLYNAEGLPASPFRTDDWPGMTVNAK